VTAPLAGYLAGLAPGPGQSFASALVIAWTTGDRRVSVRGTTYPVSAYDAALASSGLAPGDAALVLVAGKTATVLCKLADA
jgi:hypothetical protein